MAQTDIRSTTITDLNNYVKDFQVDLMNTDNYADDENIYDNPEWSKYYGYYRKIPELKKSIDALALWTLGRGYTTRNIEDKITLENITGWGEDTFNSILWNMLVTKKINGDAYAEIVRNEKGDLINLKPLEPSSMRIITNKRGRIKRYEQIAKGEANKKFSTDQILHLCNDRIADEPHGISVVEACTWVIDARNEAMSDFRRLLHRSSIRILEVDEDNPTRINTLKNQYKEAISKGEVLIVPKGTIGTPETTINFVDPQTWIRYLENFFYQSVGIPKIILGGSEEFTEASSKIAYLTFEQVYAREQTELEFDLWNQLGIKVIFEKPVSLKNEVLSSETKNTGQTGVQPNDVTAGVGK